MKNCPNCGNQVDDSSRFCTGCGFSFESDPLTPPQPQPQQYQQTPPPAPAPAPAPLYPPVNPCDKALGIVAVMFGFIGVIIAYFGGDVNGERSDYLRFYANEGLLLALFGLIGIIPFVGWIWSIFNFVCMIIAIVYACKGETRPVLFYGTLRIIK